MADLQISEDELPKISIEELPISSEGELLKKKLILGWIVLLLTLVCTAIIQGGKIA